MGKVGAIEQRSYFVGKWNRHGTCPCEETLDQIYHFDWSWRRSLPDEGGEPLKAPFGFQCVGLANASVGFSNARSALDPQKILDQLFPLIGQHALGMELHTLYRKLPMPQTHDRT